MSAAGFFIDENVITPGPLLFIPHKEKSFLETSNKYKLDISSLCNIFSGRGTPDPGLLYWLVIILSLT